ncbi:MAG: prepilin-type N-terminal cleavage/methylation domain-containing protein, partial [Deltaproteobacteria bacterium]|nr:prepilin-type N-terminal cleavage/methylation domain-containing protein [Deltaproteobacteria bacterium]
MYRERGISWARGFTLVEILVTVALIGIISAIAIPDWGT